MSGPEQSFYQGVERQLPESIYRQGMSNRFSVGVPDRYYECLNSILWVEYKFIQLPKRSNTIIPVANGLSGPQRNWLMRAYDNNIKTAVIVGTKEGGVFLDHPKQWSTGFLMPKDAFQLLLMSKKDLAKRILQELTR